MKYLIKPKAEVTEDIVEICTETSLATLRPSVDGADVLLKYEGPDPDVFSEDAKYNKAEIIQILAGTDWTEPPEIETNE